MTYSIDFRRKVLAIKEKEALSYAKVSSRFGIAVNTVFLWSKALAAKKTRNKPPTRIDRQVLRKDLEEHPDAYQYERAARLGVSKSGVYHALKRLNVTYKKNPKASQGRSRKAVYILSEDSGL
jgi:transposase